ncbi:uncharacterized protein MELLADRAFT_70083 [Melampsora larici-populina 98AG31]|uniref:CxC1-like cysteine cluster associated with KDZ transposases domain-containing protein n=1 Tax=Melampsora larici-populina (strain 98AG31 / pathotype 3-4-7) TaxID=747676 RepID=F4SDI2_MELLP|nr:uncharacterized protein MELLADRAFT_70083 [Melampsora larici-populina 98AG31]EGF97296.1 hypothetical protein MELLADRAFT_70083 [Melampsora larici-populina 98AG31]
MAPSRIIRGLNNPGKKIKPVTELQRQLVKRQRKNLAHTEVSDAKRLKELTERSNATAGDAVPIHPLDPLIDHDLYDLAPEEADELPDEEPDEIDMDHFMRHHGRAVLDPALARERHLADRLAHENRWTWQYAMMLPTFLRCRSETSNWGKEAKWNKDLRPQCDCPARTEREVDLIDLHTRRRVNVSFCKRCDFSDPTRLLQMGYMAASPKIPRTAFSLRLLVHYHTIWLRCATPIAGFCEALDDVLDDDNPVITTPSGQPRDWRLPFTAAVGAYRAINIQINKIENERLRLSQLGILAANCPKCFGPPIGISSPEDPRVIICLDGNFQHKRHALASVPIPGFNPPRPDLFLDPKLVDAKRRFMGHTQEEGGEMNQAGELCSKVNCLAALIAESLSFLVAHTKKYQAELHKAKSALAKHQQANQMHTYDYFEAQWARQRELQLQAINVRTKEKRARLEVLVRLEEQLLEARNELDEMNATNAPIRTFEQRNDLLRLPMSLASLEKKVHELAEEFGNTELWNARKKTDNRLKAALTVQVALGFLYEAKYDAIQQVADAATKTANYNARFRPAVRLRVPTFDEIMNMDLLDDFWDEAALNHPDEPWATCQATKDGIIAVRNLRSSEEELARLGRESRQLMLWGLDYQARVDASKPNDGDVRVLEWQSIHRGLVKHTSRLWRKWGAGGGGLQEVLHSTAKFVIGSAELDEGLFGEWQAMVSRSSAIWGERMGVHVFWGEEVVDEFEMLVHNNIEDDELF